VGATGGGPRISRETDKNVAHTRYAGNRIRDGRGLAYGGPSCLFPESGRLVNIGSSQTRFSALVLLVALLASLAVAAFRVSIERHARHVEIAMDYNEVLLLAKAFDYNPDAFLVELRRAGLTSLALSEELGADVSTSPNVNLLTGTQLLDAAKLSPIVDPTLSAMLRAHAIKADELYFVIDDRATFDRYRTMLPLHFSPKSIRVLRATKPWILALRSQIDYFNGISLGIPDDQLATARRLGLEIIPRFQNDDRLGAPQMQALVSSLHGDRRISTLVFFGLRNEVVGYPDHIDDMAMLMKAHHYNFGTIEVYDNTLIQKGNDTLAKDIPGQTVRVQAIAKTELDKLQPEEVEARYLLGVRERNVRVVYMRPLSRQIGDLSVEASNAKLIGDIAAHLRDSGFLLGKASPVPLYRGNNRILVGVAALAVPAIFVLMLAALGCYRRWAEVAAYLATIALYAGGTLLHHDMLARSLIALAGALLFATVAFWVMARAFTEEPQASTRAQLARSLKWTLLVTGAALLGALVVVGLMSSPLAMEEIERFRGAKLVIALPAIVALALYVFSGRFGARTDRPRDLFDSPVKVYQLAALLIVGAAGALLIMRSGNQSDIAPSTFELSLRHGLSTLLAVRPRLKEFGIGFPLMMLAPALLPAHRRTVGWLLALGIGVGIGDIIDTFSHLHTPLAISILRVFNGLVLGAIVGIVAIAIYRAILRRGAATRA